MDVAVIDRAVVSVAVAAAIRFVALSVPAVPVSVVAFPLRDEGVVVGLQGGVEGGGFGVGQGDAPGGGVFAVGLGDRAWGLVAGVPRVGRWCSGATRPRGGRWR